MPCRPSPIGSAVVRALRELLSRLLAGGLHRGQGIVRRDCLMPCWPTGLPSSPRPRCRVGWRPPHCGVWHGVTRVGPAHMPRALRGWPCSTTVVTIRGHPHGIDDEGHPHVFACIGGRGADWVFAARRGGESSVGRTLIDRIPLDQIKTKSPVSTGDLRGSIACISLVSRKGRRSPCKWADKRTRFSVVPPGGILSFKRSQRGHPSRVLAHHHTAKFELQHAQQHPHAQPHAQQCKCSPAAQPHLTATRTEESTP